MLPVTIGIIIGGIISCQTAINSRLRAFIARPIKLHLSHSLLERSFSPW